MYISLKNLFAGLAIFFLVMGILFIFTAAQVFRHNLIINSPKNIPEDVILDATLSVAIQEGFVVFAMLIIMGTISFLILNVFVISPIRTLNEFIRQVSSEKLTVRLPRGPKNEIGDLFTALNDMMTRLQIAHKREELIGKMKSEFINIAAHQLRTPLSIVKWILHMLQEDSKSNFSKEERDLLQKGFLTNERMIRLVSDMLNAARIEEGRFGFKFEKASLEKSVSEVIENLMPIAKERKINLRFKKSVDKLPNAYMDSSAIKVVLQNLISNALNYTLPAGIISVYIGKRDRFLLVSISDTGIGILKDEMNRLFTKFFRGGNAVRMQTSGSGLGLFISKNIVKAHKGKIWTDSTEGVGTTFYFTIPIAK